MFCFFLCITLVPGDTQNLEKGIENPRTRVINDCELLQGYRESGLCLSIEFRT